MDIFHIFGDVILVITTVATSYNQYVLVLRFYYNLIRVRSNELMYVTILCRLNVTKQIYYLTITMVSILIMFLFL